MAIIYRFRPIVTQENETFDALYGIEYDEMSKINSSIMNLYNNQSIKTADENGVRNFEKIYRIEEDDEKSLQERREIVYNKMIYKPPFTRQRLDSLLKGILGEDNYTYIVDVENFTLIVSVLRLNRYVYEDYIKRIRDIIPANMLLILSTPYTYIYLSGMIYGSNRTYTNVGAGNGDYNLVSPNNYVYVGDGNGSYVLSPETDFEDENKLCYYTYRELSKYSIFDTTLEIYTALNGSSDGLNVPNVGEIVDLAGAGIAYVSEM